MLLKPDQGSIQKSELLMMLIVNRKVLPSFENRKKYELRTIFQETDGKS
jgi:hypothetical protein